MQKIDRLVATSHITYLNLKQRYNKRVDPERGGISLEMAILIGVLLAIALAVAAKLTDLGKEAENKIPESLE